MQSNLGTVERTPKPIASPARILVVEAHPGLRVVLAQRLRQDGHLTAGVSTARQAMEVCANEKPDLVVTTELLEDTTGLHLAQTIGCSVLVLTARTATEVTVGLLDAGADDVLCKPFGLEELAARCRALLRRGSSLKERVSVGPLHVHLLLRQVTLGSDPVDLSPREFALLCALLMPPGVIRSRQELLGMAWPSRSGGPRSVDTQVLTLRRKLEQAGLRGEGGIIQTVRQQGYRFSLHGLRQQVGEPEPQSAGTTTDI